MVRAATGEMIPGAKLIEQRGIDFAPAERRVCAVSNSAALKLGSASHLCNTTQLKWSCGRSGGDEPLTKNRRVMRCCA